VVGEDETIALERVGQVLDGNWQLEQLLALAAWARYTELAPATDGSVL
jgi:hypothetical protein